MVDNIVTRLTVVTFIMSLGNDLPLDPAFSVASRNFQCVNPIIIY